MIIALRTAGVAGREYNRAGPVRVNLARQGDHGLAVIVAVPRESTDPTFSGQIRPYHTGDLTRLSITCAMLCT
ncbi:MAG TPA: hypothetical protein VH084_05580, partial [Mycobacterium sp.]|nr:hypothetical protein [Mycobacterium sp.]